MIIAVMLAVTEGLKKVSGLEPMTLAIPVHTLYH